MYVLVCIDISICVYMYTKDTFSLIKSHIISYLMCVQSNTDRYT